MGDFKSIRERFAAAAQAESDAKLPGGHPDSGPVKSPTGKPALQPKPPPPSKPTGVRFGKPNTIDKTSAGSGNSPMQRRGSRETIFPPADAVPRSPTSSHSGSSGELEHHLEINGSAEISRPSSFLHGTDHSDILRKNGYRSNTSNAVTLSERASKVLTLPSVIESGGRKYKLRVPPPVRGAPPRKPASLIRITMTDLLDPAENSEFSYEDDDEIYDDIVVDDLAGEHAPVNDARASNVSVIPEMSEEEEKAMLVRRAASGGFQPDQDIEEDDETYDDAGPAGQADMEEGEDEELYQCIE